jgi:hypothetical protein
MEFYTDKNGYYRFKHDHRLVHLWAAEKKLGRQLMVDEEVTHLDRNKLNNWPHNLHVTRRLDYQKIKNIDKRDLAEILTSMKNVK